MLTGCAPTCLHARRRLRRRRCRLLPCRQLPCHWHPASQAAPRSALPPHFLYTPSPPPSHCRSRFLQGPDTDRSEVGRLKAVFSAGHECTVKLLNYTKGGRPFWNLLTVSQVGWTWLSVAIQPACMPREQAAGLR